MQRDHNWGDPFLLAYKLQKQNINEMSSLGNHRGKKEKKIQEKAFPKKKRIEKDGVKKKMRKSRSKKAIFGFLSLDFSQF